MYKWPYSSTKAFIRLRPLCEMPQWKWNTPFWAIVDISMWVEKYRCPKQSELWDLISYAYIKWSFSICAMKVTKTILLTKPPQDKVFWLWQMLTEVQHVIHVSCDRCLLKSNMCNHCEREIWNVQKKNLIQTKIFIIIVNGMK